MVFKVLLDYPLNQNNFKMNESFIAKFDGSENDRASLSDTLSKLLCEELKVEQYQLICDIVRSRAPKDVPINHFNSDSKDWDALKDKSKIFGALKPEAKLKVYLDPRTKEVPSTEKVLGLLKTMVEAVKY